MHIHILGICGTFMGGLALLARALRHEVSGSDADCQSPMREQLLGHNIEITQGYDPRHWSQPPPDLVLVGNALSRGNPAVEYLLNQRLPFTSGPQWLAEQVLPGRRVLAVAGTHGKTTTTAMLAWLLERAGLNPGFLIGGMPQNFDVPARLGQARFILEADEYDSAFFDKRAKFIHYLPQVLVLGNIEFDHADIFDSMAEVRRQFHHLVRILPGAGRLISKYGDSEIQRVLSMGCWTPVEYFGAGGRWQARALSADWRCFEVLEQGQCAGRIEWELFGKHNACNALAAISAATGEGLTGADCCRYLDTFRPVQRRLQHLAAVGGVDLYDDFAHHPTAIRATLDALRATAGKRRILAALEPASNTMRLGIHQDQLAGSLQEADRIFLYQPPALCWNMAQAMQGSRRNYQVCGSVDELSLQLSNCARAGDMIVLMSNGTFGGLRQHLLAQLENKP